MKDIYLFVPSFFTKKGINTFLAILVIISIIFFQHQLGLQWVIFGIVQVVVFFYYINKLSKGWAGISIISYQRKLFWMSFLLRIFWVLFSYYYYLGLTGIPFEFEAADSRGYHAEGQWLVQLLRNGAFNRYLIYIGKDYSDMGYPLYLGLLYYLVGDSILIPRIIKALLGAITCLLIYRIGRNSFGESTGRIAGIMAMLLPNLIYYCGLHVKETEMVFLTVTFIYVGDLVIRSRRIKPSYLLMLAILGLSFFFFRTVLAVSLIASVAVASLFTSSRISTMGRRFGVFVLLVAGSFLIASTPLSERINDYVEGSRTNQQDQMSNFANRQGGNKLAVYGSRSIFLPFMLIAPFPTLVDTGQKNAMLLGGALFTRNIYGFFVLLALWALYKQRKLTEHTLLLAALGSYIFVLASSGFALSERFHLPIVPFLLVFAAYGVSQVTVNHKRMYISYLVLVSIIVIAWNWFKLAGRS